MIIMETNNLPLVSVSVITYNSSKYVLETLESIKAQTYQNIELIISDDCSKDNTVEICQQWVEQNKERFVRAVLITSLTNTGVSANCNRSKNACKGEWIKGIAGDDLLMPDCVENYVNYINEHPDTVLVFGRVEAFGASEEINEHYTNNVFDYSFFDLDIKNQLDYLIFKGNCVPASTCFSNPKKMEELGITNDERIPLLEDWPKWINVLNKGIKLHFMDKTIVKYRIHEGSLSTSRRASSRMVYSDYLFTLYYRYPKWVERNEDEAVIRMANNYIMTYDELLKIEKQYNQICSSKAYKIGKFLLKPFSWLRRVFGKK